MRQQLARSPLVHLLVEAGGFEPANASQDWAERISQWLGPLDAIHLQSTLQALPAAAHDRPGPQAQRLSEQLSAALEQQRTRLRQAIHQLHPPGHTFAEYRQRHVEQQRQMANQIAPLRAQARQCLAQASQKLRQLAMLDALYEQMLAEREQKVLLGLTNALQQRFADTAAAYPAPAAPNTNTSSPAALAAELLPAPWQADFEPLWHQLLEHELATRLQPVVGLLEALRAEIH